jgi:hypothetical protein
MALQKEVEQALIASGRQLKADLWRPEDLRLLARRSKDLVGLNAKARATRDKKKKRQYRLAAEGVVEHVRLLALLRLQVAQDHLLDTLGRFFDRVLLPILAKLLTALF